VLGSLDVTLDEVRAQVGRIVGSGEDVTTGQIPFTPRAKKVLELSLRESQALGHNFIGTEHILLGLVRENSGVAARILLDFDADAERVQNATAAVLGERPVVLPPGGSAGWTAYALPALERDDTTLLITGASIATGGLAIGLALGWLIWG
jgi:ATP-dependent Clp protease ATP-binding subunit ClpC